MASQKQSNSGCKEAVAAACTSLKQLKDEYPIAQKKIEEWVKNRRKIIQTIHRLEKEIDSIHNGATIARGAGAAGGIAGGILTLSGIVMAWRGARNATKLLECGRAVSLLGNVTSVSAALIELGYSQKIINEIQRELKEHDDLTELLSNWIQRSYILDSMLVNIFGCSIQSDSIQSVINICSECINIIQIGEREACDLMREYAEIKDWGENLVNGGDIDIATIGEKVRRFLHILRNNPELRESLHTIIKILQENPSIFEFSKLSLKVYFDMNCATSNNNILELQLTPDSDNLQPSTGALLKMGTFEAVKIATDVLSLIFVAEDIKEGKSKYSKQLDLLKKGLSMELNTVLNNYPDLYQVQQS